MRRVPFFVFAFLLSTTIFSCKKEDKTGHVHLNFTHKVDNAAIITDSIIYTNAAGYNYSITNLNYYISGVVLTNEDNSTLTFDGPFYVDLEDAATHTHELIDVPVAKYKSIRFYIGLDAAKNVSYSLPSTNANNNMAWPDPMGGGYHFMKLEGYYFNPSPTQSGFAMHLGKNANLVTCTINNLGLELDDHGAELNLVMNVNEWFTNPNTYDFQMDGTSIMTNDASLLKLAQNGVDVFTKE